MKFEFLYFVAKIRGLFPETYKPPYSAFNLNKSEIKLICKQTGWVPYRVSDREVGFLAKSSKS